MSALEASRYNRFRFGSQFRDLGTEEMESQLKYSAANYGLSRVFSGHQFRSGWFIYFTAAVGAVTASACTGFVG